MAEQTEEELIESITKLHKKWSRLTGSGNFLGYIIRHGFNKEDLEKWKLRNKK
jgi:hypothetical protein